MKKGSALIISLLVITAITAAIFGAAGLTVLELRQARRAEDSQVAFYAAEAGIERGLMEYRKDRRSRAFESEQTGFNYTWKSTYLANLFVAKDYDNDGIVLKQDETIEINIPQSLDITVKWGWQSGPGYTPGKLEIAYPGQLILSETSETSRGVNFTVPTVLRLTAKGAENPGLGIVSNLTFLTLTPFSGQIDSGETTIESVGTSNNVQRKLVATVNRQSGALVSVFDYALVTTYSTPTGDIRGQ